MTRLSTFAGSACLAAVVVILALTLPLAAANATSDDEQAAASSSLEFNEKDGSLNMEWSGPILPGMADYLRAALDRYGTASHRVVLFLDSAGGQVDEGDRVIHVLNEIKPTHRPACHCGAEWQAMRLHVHTHLPSRRRPSRCPDE